MDSGLSVLRAFCALSWVELFNAGLALAGSLVTFGAINRMDRKTERPIIFSFVTTAAGLAGFSVDAMLPGSWQAICYTLLIGGITALVIGTRRQTLWIPPRFMNPISCSVLVVTWMVFFVGMK